MRPLSEELSFMAGQADVGISYNSNRLYRCSEEATILEAQNKVFEKALQRIGDYPTGTVMGSQYTGTSMKRIANTAIQKAKAINE